MIDHCICKHCNLGFPDYLAYENYRGCLLKIWPIPVAYPRPSELDSPRGQVIFIFNKCPSDFN